jgi:hypothetical protein
MLAPPRPVLPFVLPALLAVAFLPTCEFAGDDTLVAAPASTLTCAGAPDPLATGTSVDAHDCTILAMVAKYAHPDAMLIKAQIAQESAFDVFATSPDSPCGDKVGWTPAESKSFGLIQVTPACGEAQATLLPDGHPNIEKSDTSPLWPTSLYNPVVNIEEGLKTISRELAALKARYPGCTATEYNLMSAGAFNSGAGSILGCAMYNPRAAAYVSSVRTRYANFALQAGWHDPY